jgi:predicted nucleic acid-binding protein
VANALQMAVRRRRIDATYRDSTIAALRSLPIITDPETDRHAWGSTLILAERCQLTLYDAAYLELAQRFALPLATLDHQLRKAAKSVRVPLR